MQYILNAYMTVLLAKKITEMCGSVSDKYCRILRTPYFYSVNKCTYAGVGVYEMWCLFVCFWMWVYLRPGSAALSHWQIVVYVEKSAALYFSRLSIQGKNCNLKQ